MRAVSLLRRSSSASPPPTGASAAPTASKPWPSQYRNKPRDPFAKIADYINGWTPPPANAEIPPSDDLEKLVRYEGLIERELSRAMAQLERLRRCGDRSAPAPPPGNKPDTVDPTS